MKGYVGPEFKKDAFNCPYCEVYAHQKWRYRLMIFNSNGEHPADPIYDQLGVRGWSTSKCDHCGEISFWHDEQLIYPKASIAPLPNDDMCLMMLKKIILKQEILSMIHQEGLVHF